MATDWTAPITWSGALVGVDNLNEQIRDNLTFLKNPPFDSYEFNEGADYSTSSTTFVDVDATDLSKTVETAGGRLYVHLHASVLIPSSTAKIYFELDIDGAPVGGDDGILVLLPAATTAIETVDFTRVIEGLAAGNHVVKLQWKVSANTVTMYAGAGTATLDVHPQFWVGEIG